MANSQKLSEAIPPQRLSYFFHFCENVDPKITAQFCDSIARAVVCSKILNASYCRDVLTAWSVLSLRLPDRFTAWMKRHSTQTDISDEHATLSLRKLAEKATRPAKISIEETSAMRYLLCRHLADSLFRPMSPPTSPFLSEHYERRLASLMQAYAPDCTFRATGDWMIDAKTVLLCPPQFTAVVAGADAPYTVASSVHGENLNELLRATIRTPLPDQLQLALDSPGNESSDAFVAIATLLSELVPGISVVVNAELCQRGPDSPPSLFMTSQCALADTMPESSYGVVVGSSTLVFNQVGIVKAALACLYASHKWGLASAADAYQFVYADEEMGDANPLSKYAAGYSTSDVHI